MQSTTPAARHTHCTWLCHSCIASGKEGLFIYYCVKKWFCLGTGSNHIQPILGQNSESWSMKLSHNHDTDSVCYCSKNPNLTPSPCWREAADTSAVTAPNLVPGSSWCHLPQPWFNAGSSLCIVRASQCSLCHFASENKEKSHPQNSQITTMSWWGEISQAKG